MRSPFSRIELARLDVRYWMVVGVSAIFTLARFSEAFLLLRARSGGRVVALVAVVMVGVNVVYTASAWPAGALSDNLGRLGILVVGFGLLIFADLVLAFGNSVSTVMIGVALWGLHMGLTQGLLSALVADTAPLWNCAAPPSACSIWQSGVALLAASIIAGALWDMVGPRGTFLAGALITAIALAALPLVHRRAGRR